MAPPRISRLTILVAYYTFVRVYLFSVGIRLTRVKTESQHQQMHYKLRLKTNESHTRRLLYTDCHSFNGISSELSPIQCIYRSRFAEILLVRLSVARLRTYHTSVPPIDGGLKTAKPLWHVERYLISIHSIRSDLSEKFDSTFVCGQKCVPQKCSNVKLSITGIRRWPQRIWEAFS